MKIAFKTSRGYAGIVIFFVLIFVLTAASLHSQIKTQFIKDLDGNVNPFAEVNTSTSISEIKGTNDFAVYPGFPKQGLYTVISPKTGSLYCNLDGDSEMEIIFGAGETLYAVNLDGTAVTGWPKTFAQYLEAVWACSYGDVDGDGVDEVVAGIGGPLAGWIYVFEKDGTILPGFPINAGKYPMGPVLSDLNNDNALEIIMGTRTGQLVVYKGDGTMLTGWPYQMDRYIAASVSVGDIDNNGTKNIVATSRNLLYVWNPDGTLLPGFPYSIIDSLNGSNSYSAPLLVDLTGDGKLEIVFGSHQSIENQGGVVYAVDFTGTSLPGWPKIVTNWIYGAPIAANIDADPQLEILIGEYGSSSIPSFFIYAFNVDGSVVSNFPLGPYFGIANQLTLADLDNDNQFEIIFDENIQVGDYGHYSAVELNGSPVAGWPVPVLANSSFQQALLGDINNDGTLDLVGGSFSFDINNKLVTLYAWNTGLPYDRRKIVNPMYQVSPSRDGLYIDPSTTPVELTSFTSVISRNDVTLNWSTASETNNRGFEVERKVGDNEWKNIVFVEGNGTTTETREYSYIDQNLESGKYLFRLKQIDFDGTYFYSKVVEVEIGIPKDYALEQNYPNPFNPSTKINYEMPDESFVTIKVYDVLGREVMTLLNEIKQAGKYEIEFRGEELSSGMYLYRMESGVFVSTKKFMLMK